MVSIETAKQNKIENQPESLLQYIRNEIMINDTWPIMVASEIVRNG